MIVSIGLGLEGAHHPWSKDRHTFKADELFDHFINGVLPLIKKLEKEGKLPKEPPLSLPSQQNLVQLGTMSELAVDIFERPEMDEKSARAKIEKEIKRREARGEGDIWEQRQDIVGPEIDKKMAKKGKEFKIEMRFSMPGTGDDDECDWYRGKVIKVLNKSKRRVLIRWDEECLHPDDPRESVQELLITQWNPKEPAAGAWREYLTK